MELFDNLASFGLTTKVLQIIIVGGIAVFIFGLYWRLIATGAAIAFVIFILTIPSKADVTPASNVEPAKVYESDVAPAEFIKDCIRYNEKATKSSCEKMWKEDGNGNN